MRNIVLYNAQLLTMTNLKNLNIAYYTWALMTPWGVSFYK